MDRGCCPYNTAEPLRPNLGMCWLCCPNLGHTFTSWQTILSTGLLCFISFTAPKAWAGRRSFRWSPLSFRRRPTNHHQAVNLNLCSNQYILGCVFGDLRKLHGSNSSTLKLMTWKGTIMSKSSLPLMENGIYMKLYIMPKSCHTILNWNNIPSFEGQTLKLVMKSAPSPRKSSHRKRQVWKIAFALDTGGIPSGGPEAQDSFDDDAKGLRGTRLGRIVSAGGKQLLEKLNAARKNFPMKVFLVLLGFYTANALATILGQTGDWDVLVAGVVVAAIEGIGMLMYRRRKRPSITTGRLQSLVAMINYWKAGVCLGLFVDAFKLGS